MILCCTYSAEDMHFCVCSAVSVASCVSLPPRILDGWISSCLLTRTSIGTLKEKALSNEALLLLLLPAPCLCKQKSMSIRYDNFDDVS